MKKLFTAVAAAYAVGVGMLMKKRKDEGTSKLAKDPKKSTIENVVDEIVDIHKTTYAEVKNFVATNFEDVKDFDTLKTKLGKMSEDFTSQIETMIENAKDGANETQEKLASLVEDAYAKVTASFSSAEDKTKDFAEDKKAEAKKLIDETKKQLEEKYNDTKKRIAKK